MGRAPDARQYALDFSSPAAERNFLLRSAVERLRRAKLLHLELLQWLAALQHKSDEPIKRTLAEIGKRLFVSATTARRIVNDLAEWGLLDVREETYATRGQAENSYVVCWERVKAVITGATIVDSPREPPCQIGRGGFQIGRPPYQFGSATKEITALSEHLEIPPPPPPPVAQTSLGGEEPEEEAAAEGASATTTAAAPAAAGGPLAAPHDPPRGLRFVTVERPRRAERDVADVQAVGWSALELRLRAAGVQAWHAAVQEARAAGLRPAQLAALVAHWEAGRPAWGPGALLVRIRKWRPGQAVDEPLCWPPGQRDDETARAAHRAAHARSIAAQRQREIAREQTARTEAATLETRYGPQLDRLSEAERTALAAGLPPGLGPRLLRQALLDRLAEREEVL